MLTEARFAADLMFPSMMSHGGPSRSLLCRNELLLCDLQKRGERQVTIRAPALHSAPVRSRVPGAAEG